MRGKPVSFSVTIFQSHFVEDLIVQLTKDYLIFLTSNFVFPLLQHNLISSSFFI
jgi:hypothetical protein